MKVRYAVFLLLGALLLTGCAGGEETQPTKAVAPAPLELLQTVWSAIPEERRFPSWGGDLTEEPSEGPGGVDPENTDVLAYVLLVPQEQLPHIAQAASVTHMMNANTFTCGAFQVEGVPAGEFAAAMEKSIENNPWMCGFPERMVIATFGEDTVVSAFGRQEAMTSFLDALTGSFGQQMTVTADKPLS